MTTFEETQKFRQWWLWALLLGVTALCLWAVLQQGTTDSASTWNVVITLGIVILLFSLLKLKTEVTAEGIRIKYFPLWSTFIPWPEIESAEITTYGFVGYGIRVSFRHGIVYNVSGNVGLQIIKKNGRKVLIGTQRPEELAAVVKKYVG